MTTLKLSDTGSLVEALQLALARSGYLLGSIDGIFGKLTEESLKTFQRNFSLTPDGIAGPETWAKLERFIKGYFIRSIQRGDSLWSIAAMYGTSVQAIITANPGITPNDIAIGQRITVPFGFPVVPNNISYSSFLTKLLLDGLKARYPFVGLSGIGKSVMGRDIKLLTIGEGRKQLFVNAAFHANEWLNIPFVLTFAEQYLRAYSAGISIGGKNAAELYKSTTLHLAPLVNPDGVDLVTKALQSGSYYLKALEISSEYPDIPFPSGWKANISGTDLNLQYPAEWEKAKEIKFAQGFTSPAPRDYVGTAPLTAPEAAAIYNYTRQNNFGMIIAYHSQGNIIYWKFKNYNPPESERIGQVLSDASGYPLELTPADSAYAGYKDWFIQEYNRPGYTVETGNGVNPLPISQFDDIYKANLPLMLSALNETSALPI